MSKRRMESRYLAEDIRDNDLREVQKSELDSERAAVVMTFEEATQHLQDQLTRATEERKILIEQKMEYEETLYTDRLAVLDTKLNKHKADNLFNSSRKKRRRIIDQDLNECLNIAAEGPKKSSWQSIRKVMHIKHKIELQKSEMSEEQVSKYDAVLAELKKQGFKVKK